MVKTTVTIVLGTLIAAGAGTLALPETAGADGFGPMNMMNPGRWFGGRDRYDDDYYGRGGYPPPPPAYAAPPPSYAAPAYAPAAVPRSPDTAYQEHIQRLEERIQQLEARREQSKSPSYMGGYQPNPRESTDSGGSYPPPSHSRYDSPPRASTGGMNRAHQPSSSEGFTQTAPGNPYKPAAPVFRPIN